MRKSRSIMLNGTQQELLLVVYSDWLGQVLLDVGCPRRMAGRNAPVGEH